MEIRGDVTMRDDDDEQLKIELLSQWKLEAEFRNEFWGLKRIAWPSHMVGTICYSFQTSKFKIVAVLFFFNAWYFRWRTSFFGLVHLWRPITPVKNVTRPRSPTFSESSGRQLSHGPSLDIGFFEQISGNKRFMRIFFFAFFRVRTKKKFKRLPIRQFWRLTPST